ncbi:acid phosphatase [Serratia proteamaculans]|uniref:Acid phosphatase n=1 Tax=Serratia proteamaculans TaxID=28151 RepID=A0A5Q2VHU3_SERPR|nr:phosphatase PAP2 family protein [Serratia proteamaculans]QGH63559.1 phosphatase PAP2 family protein [Serratia proteamaculans]
MRSNKLNQLALLVSLIVLSPSILALNKTAQQSEPGNSVKTKVYKPGYLKKDQVINSLALLPAPPAFDSISFLRDKAVFDQEYAKKNSARWQQAINDAHLNDGNLGKNFSAAFGLEISAKNTPETYTLLDTLRSDSGASTSSAKVHYQRIRPFAFFNKQSCTPEKEPRLRQSGSYPSGHTAIGWATALVLAEIRPDRVEGLLKRGYEFGQSRLICGVHWQSDVDAGRIIGASVVARLHTQPEFKQALARAQAEVAALINVPLK